MSEPRPRITSIRYSRTPYRKKPEIGDKRTTKKHGLQIRVVRTTQGGSWLRADRGYLYEWRDPQSLIGTQWHYLWERHVKAAAAQQGE